MGCTGGDGDGAGTSVNTYTAEPLPQAGFERDERPSAAHQRGSEHVSRAVQLAENLTGPAQHGSSKGACARLTCQAKLWRIAQQLFRHEPPINTQQ